MIESAQQLDLRLNCACSGIHVYLDTPLVVSGCSWFDWWFTDILTACFVSVIVLIVRIMLPKNGDLS